MNVKIKKSIFGIACMISGVILVNITKESSAPIVSLQLENVEALASNEGSGNYICIGSGSVDCNGYKVEGMVRPFSLPIYK